MILRMMFSLLCVAGFAAAQQGAIEDAIRKQAAEVSRLMRESERLLLEMTRIDRLVETQKQVEEEIKKLLPPEQGGSGSGGEADAETRQQLEKKHQEITERLDEMLKGEQQQAELTVQKLEELLKNLPRQQQPQSGGGSGDPQQSEREKKLREEEEEQDRKQHQPQPQDQKQEPRKPNDPQQRSDKKPQEPDPAAARRDRVEAWIAKLPPEDVERINRNDFSRVPLRYRKLVEEYTALRARRAAEKKNETDR